MKDSEPSFQVHLLAMAARWHAIQLVAREYQAAVQSAYVKMGQTYTKNPTIEEARQLAAVLDADIAAEIRLLHEHTGQIAAEQQKQATVI